MSNSGRARIGALFPLMIAVGFICGAAVHTVGWGWVAVAVLAQIVLAIWRLISDDEDVTEER